jgi:type I restriction enzyme S subunit
MKKRASFGGAVQNLNADIVKALLLPIPPLNEQQHIAEILDRFDKLCNDISEGLPAEIKARQQQYEYYRDKLLSFKEKEVC